MWRSGMRLLAAPPPARRPHPTLSRKRERAPGGKRRAMMEEMRLRIATCVPSPACGGGSGGTVGRKKSCCGRATCVPSPACGEGQGGGALRESRPRRSAAGQLRHLSHHPILDPELAKQFGFATRKRTPRRWRVRRATRWRRWASPRPRMRWKTLIRDGRPEFKGEDGQMKDLDAAPAAAPGKIRRRRALRDQVRLSSRRATSRPRSPSWSRASGATTAPRCCSASPGPARPTPWPR